MNRANHEVWEEVENHEDTSLRDYFRSNQNNNPSCILLPIQDHTSAVKLNKLPHLPIFLGMRNEDPYVKTSKFEVFVTMSS